MNQAGRTPRMKPRTVSLIQLNVAVLIWGGTAMFAKGLALPVAHIICVRSLVAAAALLVFLLALRAPIGVKQPAHYGVMAALGLLLCLHWVTYFKALKVSTAAVAILSLHTYPVFTALIEPFLFGEKLKKADVLMAACVLSGVVVMTPAISLTNKTTQGVVLGIVSGLFFMTRNLMIRKYAQQYSSSSLMFWQVLTTGLVLLPFLPASGIAVYSSRTVGLLLLLGVVFTAIPQTLFSASFKNLSAKTAAVLATLLPFYGALFGYLVHKETITPRTAAGGLIILACVIFETGRSVPSPMTNINT